LGGNGGKKTNMYSVTAKSFFVVKKNIKRNEKKFRGWGGGVGPKKRGKR